MAVHHPAAHADSFTPAELSRVVGATLVAGAAVGYLLATYDGATLDTLARIVGVVAMTTVVHMIFEARRRRRIERVDARIERVDARIARIEGLLDERLERQRRWVAYSDALSDLSGISGEDSGDISINRRS